MGAAIITADDFGMSDEINRGIVEAAQDGIVTSAALLMNAPATDAAIAMSRTIPELEIGIHLGFVEGYQLTKASNSMTDCRRYLNHQRCLLGSWKMFLTRYLAGKIRLDHIGQELVLQIEAFKQHFDTIPFVNGTQHLHLLPGIAELVVNLCVTYGVRAIRIPHRGCGLLHHIGYRKLQFVVLQHLGRRMKKLANQAGLHTTDRFFGFEDGGKLCEASLLTLIDQILPTETVEIMTHPGYHAEPLLTQMPWAFPHYQWDQERQALVSERVKAHIESIGLQLCRFRDLGA